MGHNVNGVAAGASAAERPRVHLHFREPDEEEILTTMLWSMGYEPTGPREAAFGGNGEPVAVAPVALLSGVPAAELQRVVYQQQYVPVLDYAAWRAQHILSPGDAFDVYQLRTWLEAGLQDATNLSTEAKIIGPSAPGYKAIPEK